MSIFQVTRLDIERSNTLALYVFLWRFILHTFNYAVVTYGYLRLWSYNKDHCTQNKLVIASFFKKVRAN